MYKDEGGPRDFRVTRQILWEMLPALRPAILELEEGKVNNEGDFEDYIGDYAYMTPFWTGLLKPLLDERSTDEEALRDCASFIERMLSIGDESLTEMIGIRVTHRLLGEPSLWRKFRPFAGPLLRHDVQESTQFFDWPYPDPVV